MSVHEVVIVGAGPAGIAAAIQLRRYHIIPLVFEGDSVGGLLRNANLVENYPGFPNGIRGPELVELLRRHLKSAGIEIVRETVSLLDRQGGEFQLVTERGKFRSRVVIIASGTRPKTLSTAGLDEFAVDRVFYEVYHLSDLRSQKIAIVGAGDAAFDYALNLARHNSVVINNRGVKTSCLPMLWERAKRQADIEYRENCILKSVDSDKDGLNLHWEMDGIDRLDQFDYLLIAIGRQPNLGFLSDKVQNCLKEYEIEGLIHRIGDVKNAHYRQAGISIGDGVKAAMRVAEKLK